MSTRQLSRIFLYRVSIIVRREHFRSSGSNQFSHTRANDITSIITCSLNVEVTIYTLPKETFSVIITGLIIQLNYNKHFVTISSRWTEMRKKYTPPPLPQCSRYTMSSYSLGHDTHLHGRGEVNNTHLTTSPTSTFCQRFYC